MVCDHKTLSKTKFTSGCDSVQEIWADAIIGKIIFICKLIDSL